MTQRAASGVFPPLAAFRMLSPSAAFQKLEDVAVENLRLLPGDGVAGIGHLDPLGVREVKLPHNLISAGGAIKSASPGITSVRTLQSSPASRTYWDSASAATVHAGLLRMFFDVDPFLRAAGIRASSTTGDLTWYCMGSDVKPGI